MKDILFKRYWMPAASIIALILLSMWMPNTFLSVRAQDDANEVDVEVVEYEIRMPTTLLAGPTSFRVTNNGSVDHNFRIEGEGIIDGFANDFPPGQTQILELDLAPGVYEVYSPIGDYADQGMRLTINVTEDGVAVPVAPLTTTGAVTESTGMTDTMAMTDTADMTDTMAMTDTSGMTDTMAMTDTAEMIGTGSMTGTAMMTDTTTMTDTDALTVTLVTGIDALPEVAIITDTAAMTVTTMMTGTGNMTGTGSMTGTGNMTGTGSMTATSAITDSATLTDTGMMTNTGMMTAPTSLLPASLTALMPAITAGAPTADMQAILDQLAAFEAPPIEALSAENARKVPLPGDAVVAVLAERGETVAPEAVGDISHQLIAGPDGNDILLRILTPEGDGPFPVTVYYHGGGWVIAGLDAYEPSARALTNAANTVVVMVAYRQSPESLFPAAVEDAYAAYQWVTENAADINGDPERVAVAGESAGGNLATVVSLLARENGDPMPVYQLLIYPVTQLVGADTPSALTYADAAPLNSAMLGWFKERYLAEPSDAWNAFVSPLLVQDLSGLPPATVIAAEIDPLRSEGEAYATRLTEAGVEVVYQNFDGVTHEFFGMGAVLEEAQQAVTLAAEGLTAAFGE